MFPDETYTVTAEVAADTAGNTVSDSETVVLDTTAGTLVSDTATVLESALDDGSNPSQEGRTASGNLLTNDSATAGSSITGVSLDGIDGTVWSANSDILELDTPSGIIYVVTADTIQDGMTYIAGDYIYTLTDASATATENIEYTLSDTAGNTATSTLAVGITDDSASVVNSSVDKYLNADAIQTTTTTNLVLTLDISGSMAWDADGESATTSSFFGTIDNPDFNPDTVRLDLAKEALTNLINTYADSGEVNIHLIAFSNDVSHSENFMGTPDDAIAYINSLEAGGETDYDDAMTEVMSIDPALYPEADNNYFYFVSDGEPTSGDEFENEDASSFFFFPIGTNTTEVDDWNTYANANFDEVFAIGMGNETASASLTNIGGDNTIIITDATELNAELLATLATLTGDLTGFDVDGTLLNLGADGGHLDSVEIDGTTYNYADATAINVTTLLGGEFAIDLDTGVYSYSNTANAGASETVTVNATDSDSGAPLTADLVLHLEDSVDENFLYTNGGVIDGLDGLDTLVLTDTDTINFDNIQTIANMEAINLDSGDHALTNLNVQDVIDMTDSNNVLTIDGQAGDSVDLVDGGWTQTADNGSYSVYQSADTLTTVQIDQVITVDIQQNKYILIYFQNVLLPSNSNSYLFTRTELQTS